MVEEVSPEEEYNILKRKANYHREKKEYELAEKYAERAYGLAMDENQKIYSSHVYWNSRAKRLESKKNFSEAAECYKQSAEALNEVDDKIALGEYSNYYKCLALSSLDNEKLFINNINRAIKFAKKSGDEKSECYLIGLKCENKSRFEDDREKKISYLEMAKIHYNKVGAKESVRVVDVLINEISRKKFSPYP